MRKRTYLLSNKAASDLQEIWVYTFEKWSVEQADLYYNLIISEIEFICKNIQSGKSIDYIRKGYRVSKVKSHLIFYRISKEQIIEVIRILHESMDIPTRLND